jgi:Kef-type K+ transport system membrane component KefB/predicted amino acid-binding ACT domain protein
MSDGAVFIDILVVLVAAKLAAEGAERIGLPAVAAEIVAGLVIGPSVLGLVGHDNFALHVLAELGVVLLLMEVGLQMDLEELSAVGRSSLLVATVGVVAPMALGFPAALALDYDWQTSLFVAAALTATSVGITARVFGDLRALTTIEARTVLGAAVADDVMGLVVLTVVVRIVTEGSVSILAVARIVFVAVAFLVVAAVLGLRLAPPSFGFLERRERSAGSLIVLAIAFVLAISEVARVAKLAPIVGAFVAGLALAKVRPAERIRSELAPIGHLLVPMFFVQIGVAAEISSFAEPKVLGIAAVLMVVAVVGKLVSPLGAIGSPGDKLLIGLGMLPRGEVGLIFATIGLQSGVLDDDLYASLLLVVLATTLITPALLRARYLRLRRAELPAATAGSGRRPPGGWLVLDGAEVRFAGGQPPPEPAALLAALEAALLLSRARPAAELLDWFAAADTTALAWDQAATKALLRLLRGGNARSWRFLATTGVLDTAAPELAGALRIRLADRFELDPTRTMSWPTVEALRAMERAPGRAGDQFRALRFPETPILAALLLDGLPGGNDPVVAAAGLGERLGLNDTARAELELLVAESGRLWAVAERPDGLDQAVVLQLAAHLDRPERSRSLYVLSLARDDSRPVWLRQRLDALYDLLQTALVVEDLDEPVASSIVGRRRAAAMQLCTHEEARERVRQAPREYVASTGAPDLARQARLLVPPPGPGEVRVDADRSVDGRWMLDVVSRDRPGLLAAVAGVLAAAGHDVRSASVATWPDGVAAESFRLAAEPRPDPAALRAAIEVAAGRPSGLGPQMHVQVTFDDAASPWYTVCDVRSPDRPGLLHAMAAAFAAAGVDVHLARVSTVGEEATGRFEVTGPGGALLDASRKAAVRSVLDGGVTGNPKLSRFGRRRRPVAEPSPPVASIDSRR